MGATLTFAQIMLAAREEARRLHHDYIGIAHVFMALCRLGSFTEYLLGLLGQNPRLLRSAIRRAIITDPKDHFIIEHHLNFHYTPRLRSILATLSSEAAAEMTADISEIDLLKAIIKEGHSVPLKILQEENVKLDEGVIDKAALQAEKEGKAYDGQGKESSQALKLLSRFGRDLTALARAGKLPPVIGRDKEIQQLQRTLVRATKSNPVLLGEAGVGKTAIVEKLASLIATGKVIKELRHVHLVEISMAQVTAGTRYRGDFEEKLVQITEAAKTDPNIILLIDELHTIVGSGGPEGGLDASNILKPVLGRGEIRLIGATTRKEYRKYIENDAALERRFQPIYIGEPSPGETLAILEGIRDNFQQHHGVSIDHDALEAAISLSLRYLPDRRLPDKAIDLLDEACAFRRIDNTHPRAARPIGAKDIALVLEEWTGLPVTELDNPLAKRLNKLSQNLEQDVIGQQKAVSSICRAMETALCGLRNSNRPLAVLLFVGPSGVGKTQMAKSLAHALFGSEREMIRLDMSEYNERHEVAKLIGSPPGYIGHQEGGLLTDSLRDRPFSVVLLDEIEKAHPDVFDIFLQLFEEGRLTDAHGKTVDAHNAIIIMTSNIGSALYENKQAMGFTATDLPEVSPREIRREIKKFFKPEFINRIDEIVYFQALSRKKLRKILRKLEEELAHKLAEKNIRISFSKELRAFLVEQSNQPMYGARPLLRSFERLLVQPLAHQLVNGELNPGDHLEAGLEGNNSSFTKLSA